MLSLGKKKKAANAICPEYLTCLSSKYATEPDPDENTIK